MGGFPHSFPKGLTFVLGELYGKSFDSVLRNPYPALFPLLGAFLSVLVGSLVGSALSGSLHIVPGEPHLTSPPYSVPGALPTPSDVFPSLPKVRLLGKVALLGVLLATVPLTSLFEGGFLCVLKEAYGGGTPRGRSLFDVFVEGASRNFLPLLSIRIVHSILLLGALWILPQGGPFANYALGAFLAEVLLLFAPFVVVFERAGPARAIGGGVRIVSDHPIPILVSLLFLVLTTAGASEILRTLERAVGFPGALLWGFAIYSIVGTSLSLYLLRVYESLRGTPPSVAESLPERSPLEVGT